MAPAFELRELHTHARFGDQLAIHVLQLSSLSSAHVDDQGYTVAVKRWARLLMAHDDAELDRLASEDPIMSTAKQTLEQLSQDPTTHRLARERARIQKANPEPRRAGARRALTAETLDEVRGP